MLKKLCVMAAGLFLSMPLISQSLPSGEGPQVWVRVGASVSVFNPDYGCGSNSVFSCWNHDVIGISPNVNTSAFLFQRIGAEGQVRILHWKGPGFLTETTYMGGPRADLFRYKKLVLSARFLAGVGHLSVDPYYGTGTYFAFAPGGIADYHIVKRLYARFDYEYQFWPSFSGGGGLTPNGVSLGMMYSFRRR